MNRGFYAAASAMMNEVMRHDTVANNLANINTAGFKQQKTIHQDFGTQFLKRIDAKQQLATQNPQLEHPMPIGTLGTGSQVYETFTSYAQGSLQETQNPLDVALKGEGFFAVSTPAGIRYTRDGHFNINENRELVTAEGYFVLNRQNQKITLQEGQLQIDSQGRLRQQGQLQDQLKIVDFEDKAPLLNTGQNLLAAPQNALELPARAEVSQGFLEMSNVNLASEMINMITALRAYQVSQKALQTEDDMTGKVINEVGRTS